MECHCKAITDGEEWEREREKLVSKCLYVGHASRVMRICSCNPLSLTLSEGC